VAIAAGTTWAAEPGAEAQSIVAGLIHLRSGEAREWSEFPEVAEGGEKLQRRFQAARNASEVALRLRQQDVKQGWRVTLNDEALGELVRDENDMVVWFAVPAGRLKDGENVLAIAAPNAASGRPSAPADDIRIGDVRLIHRPLAEALAEGTIEAEVVDFDGGKPLPCRLTIVDENGSLATTAAKSNDELAVRPGTIYTSNGRASFGLPAGTYTVYAGRGFEYSLAKAEVVVDNERPVGAAVNPSAHAGRPVAHAGSAIRKQLRIRREVPTEGYVACDTHIHTLTFSGHGDATIAERMITLAGEAIELPIATDHNVHIDYEPHAVKAGVRQYLTPVMGNEVTTAVGHFNVFPVAAGAMPPNHRLREWPAIFDAIFAMPGVKVAILNHARDLHSGTRPFGPKLHSAVVGENVQGWPLRFNAMEIINSGATQTDTLQLAHDWMGLLNRGLAITPVGSSDSHDVSRHFVGQGRTYIRTDDRDVTKIDVKDAVASFLEGQVLVSYGLLVELTVNGKFQSGEVAAATGDEVQLGVRVLGPHWVTAETVQLYANGRLIREEAISHPRQQRELSTGVQYQATWTLPRPKHDVHYVVIALGAGIDGPFWKTAKAYQPTSPDWQARTLAVTGAVKLDADGDGRWSSARQYAEQVFEAAADDDAKLLAGLAPYDDATAAQAAHLYRTAGGSLLAPGFTQHLNQAAEPVQRGVRQYIEAWKQNEAAALQP
jgi:hypothetical protein